MYQPAVPTHLPATIRLRLALYMRGRARHKTAACMRALGAYEEAAPLPACPCGEGPVAHHGASSCVLCRALAGEP